MITGEKALADEKTEADQSRKVARLLDMQSAMSPGKASAAAAEPVEPESPGNNSKGAVTLEAIEGLLKKSLDPLNASVSELKSELSTFKKDIKEEVVEVKTRVCKMEDGLKMTNIRMKDMEHKLDNVGIQSGAVDPTIAQKIADMEKSLQDITLKKYSAPAGSPAHQKNTTTNTLVMGGLKVSFEAATQWSKKLLGEAHGPAPKEVYKKGPQDEIFKGLMFLKFSSCSEAQQALEIVKHGVAKEISAKMQRIVCGWILRLPSNNEFVMVSCWISASNLLHGSSPHPALRLIRKLVS
jgi:hypothetical protein